jgi:hypothetical protein
MDGDTMTAKIVTGAFPTLSGDENTIAADKTGSGSLKPVKLGLVRTDENVAGSTSDTNLFGFIKSVEYVSVGDGIEANVVIATNGGVATYMAEADNMTPKMAALSDMAGQVVRFDLSGTELDETKINSTGYLVGTDNQRIVTAIDTANNRLTLALDELESSNTTGGALIGNYDYADDLNVYVCDAGSTKDVYIGSEASIVLSNLDAESFYYVIPVYDAEDEMITDLFITLTDGETLTENV